VVSATRAARSSRLRQGGGEEDRADQEHRERPLRVGGEQRPPGQEEQEDKDSDDDEPAQPSA
jgi:hypothetical protein